jgi:hypothetical protein
VDLGPNERELLRAVAEQLKELLLETDSPVLRRLFPPPYGDDTERNEGYAALAGPELIEHRLAALDLLVASVQATTLDEDEIGAWMRSINDVRLVLGTVLDITDDESDIAVDESNVATYQAYELLGSLLDIIVEARSERL